jgi:hypothetical protein
MSHNPPILVGPLLPQVCGELHCLLRSLTHDEWHRPTVSSQRQVRDIVSHLLDGSLRRLSMQRDRYSASPRPGDANSKEPLLDYLNRLNADWERATRRLSPAVLLDLLVSADRQFAEFMNSLDPFAPAIFPVAWAGEETSLNWFDVARDYTEKWHHTQQIFEAVNHQSTIMTRRLYHPCLDTFLRALPYTFRDVEVVDGTAVTVEIVGDGGGVWQIVRRDGAWSLVAPTASSTAKVSIPQADAWKVFTKRRTQDAVLAQFPDILFEGDEQLGRHVLGMVSVMA